MYRFNSLAKPSAGWSVAAIIALTIPAAWADGPFVVTTLPPAVFHALPPLETSHLAFVTEYARELAAIENIRTSAEQEQKQAKKGEEPLTAIHALTLMQFELRARIGMLNGMRLNQPFDELIPSITELYEDKIRSHQRMIDIASEFIVASQPDVDYGKLVAEMPKIRAESDYIDHALFDAVPLIFATLIDQKPDSKNHVSHLIITKAE